jgi:hypothetical protein
MPESAPFPAVTVLIPAYNLERYIADAIRSAAGQDYNGPLQVIVLDDGSTDQTYETARQTAQGLPQVQVYQQSNQGRAGARNRLLELASTELVGWLDGDDMADPSWLREQVELALGAADLVAVSGQGYAMTANRQPIGPIVRPRDHAEIEAAHLQGHSNAFFQSCTVVRKSKVSAAGGYRSNYSASEDYDLWLRLAEFGRFANHHRPHLYYRVHSTSANATLSLQQKQQGSKSVNEARQRRGLAPLNSPSEPQDIPASRLDWNRQVYWINIALRSGNPWTAVGMAISATRRHPISILLWLMLAVALADSLLQLGNRSGRFRAGHANQFGTLGRFTVYRFASQLVRWKRCLTGRQRP